MIQVDQSTRFKNILILTFILIILMGILYFLSLPDFFGIKLFPLLSIGSSKNQENASEEVLSVQQPSVFEEISKPIYGFPKKLLIDPLGIDIEVIAVGVDEDGYLETPKNWNEAGWYQRGARPAEIGNLLINAHYDDSYGRPAAFWKLKNIKVGDKVSVLDSYGRYFHYEVVDVYHIGINDPERLKIFEPFNKEKAVMTLITCGGVWVSGEGTYSKRLVVNAELILE